MKILLAAFVMLAAGAAQAQYKVSEIVAKGGQVMTAEQIRAELAGRTVSGVSQGCTDFVFSLTGNQARRCNWYWKVGDECFATNSRTDDEAAERFVDCLLSGGKDCDGGFSVAKRGVRK